MPRSRAADQARSGRWLPFGRCRATWSVPRPGSTEMLTIHEAAAGGGRREDPGESKARSEQRAKETARVALPVPFGERVGGGSGDRM